MYRNGIETPEQLEQAARQRQRRIEELTAQRRPLYTERRMQDDQGYERITKEIKHCTATLQQQRRELRICEAVQRQTADLQKRCDAVDEAARQSSPVEKPQKTIDKRHKRKE